MRDASPDPTPARTSKSVTPVNASIDGGRLIRVSLLTIVAVLALLIALIRHLIVLGRAARRFQEEVIPIAEDVLALSDRHPAAPGLPPGAPRPRPLSAAGGTIGHAGQTCARSPGTLMR